MLLVTGATGFVASALRAELARRGIAYRPASRAPAPGQVAVGEVDGTTDWSAALRGVDAVIHLAARVHVMAPGAAQDDEAFRRVNVAGTLNLARQAARAGVRRFIFLSSIKVNGETTDGRPPFSADEPPDPRDAYARSKLEAERALLALAAEGALEVVVIRPPLVYGPGVKANFAAMMRWVERGVPLPLGAVTNRRSLVYAGNLADLLILATVHPAAANQVFLASDGQDLSTAELLRALAQAMGKPPRLFSVPPPLLAAAARIAGQRAIAERLLGSLTVDIGKTRTRLAWTPPFTVAAGLSATVAPA